LYKVKIYAQRDGKRSQPAVGQHLTSIPRPTDLQISRISTSDFRVSWEPPNINVNIAKYKISLTSIEAQTSSINTVRGNKHWYKARGLLPGTNYRVEVSALIKIPDPVLRGRFDYQESEAALGRSCKNGDTLFFL